MSSDESDTIDQQIDISGNAGPVTQIGKIVDANVVIAHPGAQIFLGSAAEAPSRPQFRRYLRMLAVVAAPVTGQRRADPPPAPLNLWAEWRRLTDAVWSTWEEVRGRGAPWAVVRLNPPTRNALADALTAGEAHSAYQVTHFSGHGAADGLALEDELGRTDFVDNDELVALFQDSAVRLVILNACDTEALARRLVRRAGVPAVIATTDSLRDDEACLLTARLYAWLAREQTVGQAFDEALRALELAYRRGDLPIPRKRQADADAYIAERLAVPQLYGQNDLRLTLTISDDEQPAEEPMISLAEPRSNLRYDLLSGFVGRGPELVQVTEWLRDRPRPVVVVSGLGGIGKSALATMAALRQGWRFRAVVTLSAREDPAACTPDVLVSQLDAVLRLGGELTVAPTQAQRLQRAVEALNATPTLLVLDNLESLNETQTRAWADFLARLHPHRSSVALLTLRPAEKHPLTDLAETTCLSLPRLGEADALRLLVDGLSERKLWAKVEPLDEIPHRRRTELERLGRQAHVSWLPIPTLAALDDLAARAGHHPYQLRLALGALRHAHVTWDKVKARLRDLRGGDWEQQAEVLVGQMMADLSLPVIALLQTMLVFRGGASYEALRAVAQGDDEDEVAFDDRLTQAVESSLLEAGLRYDLHPLTRAYLETRQPPEEAQWLARRQRHAAFFEEWAWEHHWDFDVLETELPNLRAGFELVTAKAMRDEKMVRDYAAALHDMFQARGYWDDVLAWMTEAARACERLDNQKDLAAFYTNIAGIHWDRGNYNAALEWLQKTAGIDKARGDKAGLGNTYSAIGVVYLDLGDYRQALEWLNKALPLRRESGDRGGLAVTQANIGSIHYSRGEYDAALEMYQRAAPVLEEIGDRAMLAGVYNNIGSIHYSRGEYDAALEMYQRAAPVLEEIGDRATLAGVESNLGVLCLQLEDCAGAELHLQRSVALFDELRLDTDIARGTRRILAMGQEKGWEAASGVEHPSGQTFFWRRTAPSPESWD